MAGASKQQLIEGFRAMPEGIQEFLDVPLPEAPTISAPADVDAAIIASGLLSKYLADVFGAFAGYTPIEMLARIGQHNTVHEIAMLAGLEYIAGGDPENQDLTFTEPAAGQSYTPGEVRFVVSARNGAPGRVTLTVDGGNPLRMTSDGGQTWTQYQTIIEAGAHSAEVSAEFAAGDHKTASVSFTIEDYDPDNPPDPPPDTPPGPPGGDDENALQRAVATVKAAYQQISKLVSFGITDQGDLDIALTKLENAAWVVAGMVRGRQGYTQLAQELTVALERAWDYPDPHILLARCAVVASIVWRLARL